MKSDTTGRWSLNNSRACRTSVAAPWPVGDYVLALKGNQGNLHQSVQDWIWLRWKTTSSMYPFRRLKNISRVMEERII